VYPTIESHVLSERLRERGIETRFINEHYLPYRFYPERIEYLRERLDRIVARTNHDMHPVCYYFDMVLWGEEFSQGTEKLFCILFDIKPWQFLFGIVLLVAVPMIMFKNRRVCIPAGVFISGCGGIVMEMVLIISFEILFGYMYHLIGLIIAGFMVGIAGGTWLMNLRVNKIKNRILVYSLLQAAMAMYLFLTPVIFLGLRMVADEFLIHGCIPGLFFILTVLAGILIGLIFPLANRIYSDSREQSRPFPTGGIMYAVDMGGACVGSLIAAVLTIPVFGITWTCVIFGILNLLMGIATMIAVPRVENW
jgi:spermidine synthase